VLRRIILLLSVVALMAAMVAATAVPALADKPPYKPPQSEFRQGQYTCYFYDVGTDEYIVESNVPAGQASRYVEQGYNCYSQQF
jgi:hypothetical protein